MIRDKSANLNKTTRTPIRIEIKDLLRLRDLQKVEAALLTSQLGFHSPFPPRRINSLYFDSYDFSTRTLTVRFEHSTEDTPSLVWQNRRLSHPDIGIQMQTGPPFMEDFTKTQISIDLEAVTPSAYWDEEGKTSISDLSRTLALTNTRPTTLVSYSRRYFESGDGRLRITLDEESKYRDQTVYPGSNLHFSRHHPEKLVLEIKVAEKDSDLLYDLCKTLPFVPRRFSKYCESLLGHLSRWI